MSANTYIVSLVVFFLLISFLQLLPMCWSCVFCFFPLWSGDHITNSAYSGTIEEYLSIFASYKSAICLIMIFQKDRLHSADVPVRWILRLTPHHVFSLPRWDCAPLSGSTKFRLRWLWDECSPRLLGSLKPSTCRSSRVFPAICGRIWWVRVCLYHFALTEKAGFGLAADAVETSLSVHVPSFVPQWSSTYPRQCIATIFSRTLFWRREQVVFLAPLYALVMIRQNFAQFKIFKEDIDVFG